MLDNNSESTAMTVNRSRSIRLSVTTRANPLSLGVRAVGWFRNGCSIGIGIFNFLLKEWMLCF
jgi:hypothetical protein